MDSMIIADPDGKGYGFAKSVCDYVKNRPGRKFSMGMNHVLKTGFTDGEYKLRIRDNIRRKRCFYFHDPNKDAKLWVSDLLFALEAISTSSPTEINVVFPYFRYARQDRKDASRASVNSKAIADMVSHYADRGLTIDLHAPQIQEFFGIPFDNLESSRVLINHLRSEHRERLKNLVLVSPDAGGGKRLQSLQGKMAATGIDAEFAVCYKRKIRDENVEEVIVTGDVEGKNCLIVDDINGTGGTLSATEKALRKAGAARVEAYCTHGLMLGGPEKYNGFDELMTTDTLDQSGKQGVEVISVVELFGEAIYRTIVGESLSSLFA